MKNLSTNSLSIQRIRQKAVPVLRRYQIHRAAIFGSFARGEEKKKSDIDFLVDTPASMSLFEFAGLKQDLEEKLERRVDLVSSHGIHTALKRRILKEKIQIYEKKY